MNLNTLTMEVRVGTKYYILRKSCLDVTEAWSNPILNMGVSSKHAFCRSVKVYNNA